jgi:hypothetical protein
MPDKTFINGIFVTEKEFANGGSILKVNIPEDKIQALAEQLKFNSRDGWVRLVIAKNRQPTISKASGKVVSTHSVSVDDWQPNQSAQRQPAKPAAQPQQPQSSDVPF